MEIIGAAISELSRLQEKATKRRLDPLDVR